MPIPYHLNQKQAVEVLDERNEASGLCRSTFRGTVAAASTCAACRDHTVGFDRKHGLEEEEEEAL
jgi:hypothetical protein